MSSVPCVEYCSDEKSSQTSLLMELSPLSNNTQPSPKDSGVDVSSPSRRDEDTIFGSPQVQQTLSSGSNGTFGTSSIKYSNGLLETSSTALRATGQTDTVNIASNISSPDMCSLKTNSKKSGENDSKTSKFYSRDRKKHFNIGELEAKEFRKIIMSDSKEKRKKCPLTKSSSLVGKCSGPPTCLGTTLKKIPEDLNKNYAVAPIEEKKVGIVIRVTKPFSMYESKKRKLSADKLESHSKVASLLNDGPSTPPEEDKIDFVDRSSNMSPTMPELHKETPFVGGKFIDDNRRTTRSKVNNPTPCGDNFLSERRSNLRSATKTTPQSKPESNCPLPPIITAIEPQQENSLNYLPKKITCKLADHVIVKTLTSDHQTKSCERPKKSKSNKSFSKETSNYLQVKSISGLKIKLAKPRPSASETISVDRGDAPKSDCISQSLDHLERDTTISENIISHLGVHNVCSLLSVHTTSSSIMSSVKFCSLTGQNSVHTGNTCSVAAMTGTCDLTASHKLRDHNRSNLEDSLLEKDGKVKITQEKEVIMPDGKKMILKLKMLVPSPVNPPLRHEIIDQKTMEELCHTTGVATTFCSEISTLPQPTSHFSPSRRYENNSCTYPSPGIDSLSTVGLSDKMNLASDSRSNCPISINNWQFQSASQNAIQFSETFQSNEAYKDTRLPATGKLSWSYELDGMQSPSLDQEHWTMKNHLNGTLKESILHSPITATIPQTTLHQSSTLMSTLNGTSKCNSNDTFKSVSLLSKSGKDISSDGDMVCKEDPDFARAPSNHAKSVLSSQMDFNAVKAHSLETVSKGSMKIVRDELDEYGEMPTLEKNEISDQTYFFNQCIINKLSKPVITRPEIDDRKFFEDSKNQMLEKENLKEKSIKKKFKFDGLELEYSISGEDCATRCLRKRSKDEKDEPEKLERPEKPKRKRGISRSSVKKMKSSLPEENSELLLQDMQIHQMSYAPTSTIPPSPLFLNQDKRPESSLMFSMPRLNQSFDFSTPPPSDASCPLGELALSLMDDSKSTPLVCSKPFCVNLSAYSDSSTHSSSIASSSYFVASSTTLTSAFYVSSGAPLPWNQALPTSPKSSVENLNLSCFSSTRSHISPVISSHPSPLSSVFMTPLSAEIPLCPISRATPHASDSLISVTTSPPSPPPPPPKFVRSFKEVESVTDSLPSPSTHPMTSPSYPLNAQSTDGVLKESSSSSLLYNSSDGQSGLSKSNGLFSRSQDPSLLGCTKTLNGSFPFALPTVARCNSRSKSALFEEKSLRLHRISLRLQANSAICLKSSSVSSVETNSSDGVLSEKFASAVIQSESEKKREPCDKAIEEEEVKRKMLDDKLKGYYLNNEDEIAEYVADQMQLVKLRNKAYRLFCCLFPEVQMPLRLSPDSEAVDYLLESAVNMLEAKICEVKYATDGDAVSPSEEKAQERSELYLSRHRLRAEGQPHPCVTLCWQPHKCLLQLQGIVRRFLCLVLPHLDAYLSSDASLSIMDKIVDRVILANCAFIGLGSTHNGPMTEECENDDETKHMCDSSLKLVSL